MEAYKQKIAQLPGNNACYNLGAVAALPASPLRGKTLIFLGSSVTYGACSKGVSFADYLSAKHGCCTVKEAVSGTTLVDNGPDSYISRLKTISTGRADAFVCQLSTNDATQHKPLGIVSPSKDPTHFDTQTIAGAMEYIIAYASDAWHCPVYFYTNPVYDNPDYLSMVDLLPALQAKWGIRLIDLWNDAPFNVLSERERSLFMADPIHPTQAGYLLWWLPKFESVLLKEAPLWTL